MGSPLIPNQALEQAVWPYRAAFSIENDDSHSQDCSED